MSQCENVSGKLKDYCKHSCNNCCKYSNIYINFTNFGIIKIHIIILEIILFTHYDIDGNISTSDPTVSTETPGSNENLRLVNVMYHIIQIGNLDYFI